MFDITSLLKYTVASGVLCKQLEHLIKKIISNNKNPQGQLLLLHYLLLALLFKIYIVLILCLVKKKCTKANLVKE